MILIGCHWLNEGEYAMAQTLITDPSNPLIFPDAPRRLIPHRMSSLVIVEFPSQRSPSLLPLAPSIARKRSIHVISFSTCYLAFILSSQEAINCNGYIIVILGCGNPNPPGVLYSKIRSPIPDTSSSSCASRVIAMGRVGWCVYCAGTVDYGIDRVISDFFTWRINL